MGAADQEAFREGSFEVSEMRSGYAGYCAYQRQ